MRCRRLRFGNTPRVESLLKNGKLRLSLSDAVTLALENNLDIAIARFNLSIADTDIMRAKSGESVRGVATGLVQGTPGGGSAALAAALPAPEQVERRAARVARAQALRVWCSRL